MGGRDAGRGGAADAGADAGDDAERDAGGGEGEGFLGAATEHQGIPAFQTHHSMAGAGKVDQALVDAELRGCAATGAFTDRFKARVRCHL